MCPPNTRQFLVISLVLSDAARDHCQRSWRRTLPDTIADRREIVYTVFCKPRCTTYFIYGDTVMQNYDEIFKAPEVDVAALVGILEPLGAQRGWDDEQLRMHVHYAAMTHVHHGKRSAIKYLESLR